MSYFPQGSVVKNPPTMQETQETPFPSLGWADPLENKMTTHSSILAWEIPWTEEPGRIQSMGSQKSRTRLTDLKTTIVCPTTTKVETQDIPGVQKFSSCPFPIYTSAPK